MKEQLIRQIDKLIEISLKAGDAILEVYSRDFEVLDKDDKSPLTEADKKSNECILEGLKKYFPGIPFISEETKAVDFAERKNWSSYWLIDPLDGTKEFIKRNGEFTVNIAYVENGVPQIGLVHIPVSGNTYVGIVGEGAFLMHKDGSRMPVSAGPHYSLLNKVKVVGSRSHSSEETLAFVEDLRNAGKEVEFASSGSSLKLCMVADGSADVYPRFGPTMEWDTAAAQAVVMAAGKKVLRYPEKTALEYNKENLLNPWFIVE